MNAQHLLRRSLLAVVWIGVPRMAPAQLLDGFERYSPGDLCGQSAWDEWPDRRGMDACGVVTQEQSRSRRPIRRECGSGPRRSRYRCPSA